jgi:hypothetical protein
MAPILGIYASQISGHLFAPSGAYDSIATTTVGSGGTASVTFSSIPQTYTHLQIRTINRDTGTGGSAFQVRFNGDTGSNYRTHGLVGYGSGTPSSFTTVAQNRIFLYGAVDSGAAANVFSANVVDILDYTNTNKNTVVRSLAGWDSNSSGESAFGSGMWMNTSAVTSVTVYMFSANFAEYSSIALYGIKGN